jgi:hypothetical protein
VVISHHKQKTFAPFKTTLIKTQNNIIKTPNKVPHLPDDMSLPSDGIDQGGLGVCDIINYAVDHQRGVLRGKED